MRKLKTPVIVGVLLLVAFLLASTHWEGGISPDTRTYESIAVAAPGFPDTDVGSAHSERFAWPWLAGTLGEVLPDGARTGLWVVVIASMILTVLLLVAICLELGLGTTSTLLCAGLLILNPYTMRLYVQDPGPVDPLFMCGIAVLLWALVTRRLAFVLLGSLAALLARQTALLAVPAVTAWLYFGEGWRARPDRDRLVLAVAIVAGMLVVYAVLKLASSSFTYSFAPGIPGDTILPGAGDPGTASQLAGQVARVGAPFVALAGCLAGVVVGLWRAGQRIRLPVEFWCALLIGAAIVVQPLVISPNFEGFEGNQARISALGVFPVCVALAYALRAAGELLERAPWWALAGGAVALALSSLNERFSTLGPDSEAQFAVLEILAAAALTALLAIVIGGRRGRKGPLGALGR